MDDQLDILKEFAAETRENLVEVEQSLVKLEENPSDLNLIGVIFRAVHTVKGTCGFFGLKALEKVTHTGENLLSALRDGRIQLTPPIATVLLELVDVIRQFMDRIEETGNESGVDCTDVTGKLAEIIATIPAPATSMPPKPVAPAIAAPAAVTNPPAPAAAKPQVTAPPQTPKTTIPPKVQAAPKVTQPPRAEPAPKVTAAPKSVAITAGPANLQVTEEAAHSKPHSTPPAAAPMHESEQTVRVSTGLLDQLITLVGELVLARNQIVLHLGNHPDPHVAPAVQRVSQIASELQETVMKTRMQPLSTVFGRFPRFVRDTAHMCKKEIEFVVDGEQTELDRNLIEAIKDPLTHIIRNCIDHGVEAPEVRESIGKPREGKISISAYHKGGFVNIEIADDGCGIDNEKIKAKAIKMGLLTPHQASQLSNREIQELIFLPGFSTASQVTNVSGRGVGMDVVRNKIEAIGGIVEFQSAQGEGTMFKLKIPLTLAIIPALIVQCCGESYAIPQGNLQELLLFRNPEESHDIEVIGNTYYHRQREHLLPLIYLSKILYPDSPQQPLNTPHHIAVLQAGDYAYGLVIEKAGDSQEIVVNPLDFLTKDNPIFTGTLIMGNGRAALILDPVGLAQVAHIAFDNTPQVQILTHEDLLSNDPRQRLLMFHSTLGGRMAIPLSAVARLEEIELSHIEYIGGQSVIQYRGTIMPVIDINHFLPERRESGRANQNAIDITQIEKVPMIVHAYGDNQIGLIVAQILDTVQDDPLVHCKPSRQGILYTFVHKGFVAECVDLRSIVEQVEPLFYSESSHGQSY